VRHCWLREICVGFLVTAEREAKQKLKYRGPPRHPSLPQLPLHGLGYVQTPLYGGREQFHLIGGGLESCPWPDEAYRQVFEDGMSLLQRHCLSALKKLDPTAVAEWHRQADATGDPSVCDAFYYPGCPGKVGEEAMGGHLDPGWLTVKQGSRDHGLEVWNRNRNEYQNIEDPNFYGSSDMSPEDAIVIFAGERLQEWTEGLIPAVHHRVLVCDADRLSFVYELRDQQC